MQLHTEQLMANTIQQESQTTELTSPKQAIFHGRSINQVISTSIDKSLVLQYIVIGTSIDISTEVLGHSAHLQNVP